MKNGVILVVIGGTLFLGSLLLVLPIENLYLLSLVMMFGGVVLIGLGGALVKQIDTRLQMLDSPSEKCYYCEGSGKIEGIDGFETCPRCGGSGAARPED